MSYSISARAANVEDLKSKVEEELNRVVDQQPSHEKDKDAAFAAVDQFLSLLREPKENEEVYASVSGSMWASDDGSEVHSTGFNITAGFTEKAAAPASNT